MKSKIIFSEEIKTQIYQRLDNGGKLRQVAREFGTNQNMIYELLYERYKCLEPPIPEYKLKVFKCKVTNHEIVAKDNRAGQITTFLKKYRPDAELFGHNKSIIYYIKNKKEWYEQYFDILYIDKPLSKKCKLCDEYETDELVNKTGAYSAHLTTKHKIDILEYLDKFPEETEYFNNSLLIKKAQKDEEFKDDKNYVVCKVCGEKLKIISNTHLKRHNLTVEEYKLKYTVTNIASDKYVEHSKYNYYHTNKFNNYKYGRIKTSKAETEIVEFLIKNGVNVVKGDKKLLNGSEIDLILPDYNIAIEYDGLYWHGELNFGRGKNYHLAKTLELKKLGYELIHIFEDEWINDKNLVFNRLLEILKLINNTKIDFLTINKTNSNTIQIFNKEAILSEIKFNIFSDYIIINDFWLNINVDKKYVIENIIFYFKNRFSNIRFILDGRYYNNDNIFNRMDMSLIEITEPNYYFVGNILGKNKKHDKNILTLDIVKEKYPSYFNEYKSFDEILKSLKVDRIWDCGNYIYEYCIK